MNEEVAVNEVRRLEAEEERLIAQVERLHKELAQAEHQL